MLLAGIGLLASGLALVAAVLVLLEPDEEDVLYVVPGKQTELEALMADDARVALAPPVPLLVADGCDHLQHEQHDDAIGG